MTSITKPMITPDFNAAIAGDVDCCSIIKTIKIQRFSLKLWKL